MMPGLELACVGERQAVPVAAEGQSIAATNEQLRQQRLLDRDQHHHKQLWTKHSHGGPYRKVRTNDHADLLNNEVGLPSIHHSACQF